MDHSFSNTGRTSQQLTPPGSSHAGASEWFQHNPNQSMVRTTQSSSPISLVHSTDILQMHGFEESQNTPSHNISVTREEYHWGQYGVSEMHHPDEISPHTISSTIFPHVTNVNPSNLIKEYTLSPNSHTPLAPAPQVPILSSPSNPGALAPVIPVDNFHNTNPFGLTHTALYVDVQRSSYTKGSRATKNNRIRQEKRQRGGDRRQTNRATGEVYQDKGNPANAKSASSTNQPRGDKVPRERLQSRRHDKGPENHYLLGLREKHAHARGRGMWDRIVEDWQKQYPPEARATLQMRLLRSVSRPK